jgi:hypothetical protein
MREEKKRFLIPFAIYDILIKYANYYTHPLRVSWWLRLGKTNDKGGGKNQGGIIWHV